MNDFEWAKEELEAYNDLEAEFDVCEKCGKLIDLDFPCDCFKI